MFAAMPPPGTARPALNLTRGSTNRHAPYFLPSGTAAGPALAPRWPPIAAAATTTTADPAARDTTALFLQCWRASTFGIFVHDLMFRVREINGNWPSRGYPRMRYAEPL
jgi:hypothetical protein